MKELQSFLGSVNFYRVYIPRFAQVAQPLYELTQKGQPWRWDAECETAFQELRERLVTEPVKLAFPQWGQELYVEADASGKAVAAVLSQNNKYTGSLQPISYFSSGLTESQKLYSAGQLEAWALVAASRKWDLYLKAAPKVILVTDYCPLQWLRRQKDPRHQFARWLLELETIPYTITFRPGSSNHVPDYLSRVPGPTLDWEVNEESRFEDKIYPVEDCEVTKNNDETESAEGTVTELTDYQTVWIELIAGEQHKDLVIADAKSQLTETGKVQSGQLKNVSDHLRLVGGILHFYCRVVVPTKLRREAIQITHQTSHFGQAKTLEQMKRNYFWARMTRDIKQYCRNCLVCQKMKSKLFPAQSMELFKDEGWLPGDAVAMDVETLPWGDFAISF